MSTWHFATVCHGPILGRWTTTDIGRVDWSPSLWVAWYGPSRGRQGLGPSRSLPRMDGCARGSRDAGWMGTSHGSRAAARHDPSFSVVPCFTHVHAYVLWHRQPCGGGDASLSLPKSQALAAGQMRWSAGPIPTQVGWVRYSNTRTYVVLDKI